MPLGAIIRRTLRAIWCSGRAVRRRGPTLNPGSDPENTTKPHTEASCLNAQTVACCEQRISRRRLRQQCQSLKTGTAGEQTWCERQVIRSSQHLCLLFVALLAVFNLIFGETHHRVEMLQGQEDGDSSVCCLGAPLWQSYFLPGETAAFWENIDCLSVLIEAWLQGVQVGGGILCTPFRTGLSLHHQYNTSLSRF